MFFFLSLALADEPMATLFVEEDGSYLLAIHLEEDWRNAEICFDKERLHYKSWPDGGIYYEGSFSAVPDELRIKMELAGKDKGAYLSLYVPTIPLPEEAPILSGSAFSPLPKPSFQWWLIKRINSIQLALKPPKPTPKTDFIKGGYLAKDAP